MALGESNGRSAIALEAPTYPTLSVIRGHSVGESYSLAGLLGLSERRPLGAERREGAGRHGELVLGRGLDADIELRDEDVAPRHAVLAIENGIVLLRDLGSRNGTFVNGRRIAGTVALSEGDKLQLAPGTMLKFTAAERVDEPQQRRLHEAALLDPLTHSWSRPCFLDRLERESRFASRHAVPLTLVAFDVNDLRSINARHGTTVGDALLVELAARVRGAVRREDILARLGGDDFALLCRRTPRTGATILLERIRASVECQPFLCGTSISLGAALHGLDANDGAGLLAAADAAVRAAKRALGVEAE